MTAFLADENIGTVTINALRAAGHDVKSVAESSPSIKDSNVLLLAALEKRIVITFDSDYGELIFNRNMPKPSGVVYLRVSNSAPMRIAALILEHLSISENIFEGRFNVISDNGTRYKLL